MVEERLERIKNQFRNFLEDMEVMEIGNEIKEPYVSSPICELFFKGFISMIWDLSDERPRFSLTEKGRVETLKR